MFKISMAAALLAGIEAHHHHHHSKPVQHHLLRLQDDPICSSQGCFVDHYKDESKPYDWYTVPDFGVDSDIAASSASLADAEKSLKHSWVISDAKPPPPPPKDYFVPNFGLDQDVKDTFGALGASETQHNRKWEWKLLPKKAFERGETVSNFQKQIIN